MRAARFAGLMHLLEERRHGGVGLTGGVFGDLDGFALGGGRGFTGFADRGIGIGLGEGFPHALLLVRSQAGKLRATVGGLLAVAFAETAGLALRLGRAAFASGLGLGLAFGASGAFAARLRLRLRLAVGLFGLTALHCLLDLLEDRGDFGVGLAGGLVGDLAGLLLGFLRGLLGLGSLLVGFLHRGVLLGFLHGLMEALLFVGRKGHGQAEIGAALGARRVGPLVRAALRARGVFGGETEGGGEQEEGDGSHGVIITAEEGREFRLKMRHASGLATRGPFPCPMGMLPRLAPVVLLFSAFVSAGELKLVSLFSDHAVLQAGDAAVFGKAHPGAKVGVKLGSVEASATAGSDGKWSATLAGLKPTEQGKDLVVSSGEEVFTAHDVIVGEVWIGSGQSNMEWTVERTSTVAEAKSRPADAGLRVFTVARTPKAEPADDVQGSWKLAAPDTVGFFTAAGFYFARELRANIKQPVGVIHTSIGGTRAEAWGPKGMYADVPDAKDFDAKEAAAMKARAAALEKLQAKIAAEKDKAAAAKLRQDAGKLAPVWSNGPHMNWNGMVAPFVGYSFRGALWYQGESNAGQPEAYKWVLGSMIKSWQKAWGKEFPFIIVQLPRFMAKKPELAVEEGWPAIRESMEWIADNVPGAMMTVNIDLGEEKDIHPKDKLPIGERLAAVALQRVYKSRADGEAPRVKGAERQGDAWVLTYDRAVTLKNDGKGFALKTADGKWAFAQAKADGARVTVTAAGVKEPKEVRYAWANFPEVSVFSAGKDGLPAGPYRSGK